MSRPCHGRATAPQDCATRDAQALAQEEEQAQQQTQEEEPAQQQPQEGGAAPADGAPAADSDTSSESPSSGGLW